VDVQHVCQEHVIVPLQVKYPVPSDVVKDDPRNPHFIGNDHQNLYASPLFLSHQPYALPPQHIKQSEHQNPRSPGSILTGSNNRHPNTAQD
jgi:hypothetical protein